MQDGGWLNVEVEFDGTHGVFFSELEDDVNDFISSIFVHVFSSNIMKVSLHRKLSELKAQGCHKCTCSE